MLRGFQIPLVLPSRTLGGGKFVNRFGRGVERTRSARPPLARWLEDKLCPDAKQIHKRVHGQMLVRAEGVGAVGPVGIRATVLHVVASGGHGLRRRSAVGTSFN